jgi:exodeoxyribonuclease V gamma subunit
MHSQLHIITSNHLEVLATGLAGLLQSLPDGGEHNPLQPEQVLVQSKGMQKWLCMSIARINGVCANVEFPFPNAFLERLYGQLQGRSSASNPYDPRALAFRILYMLPDLLDQPEFHALRSYLSHDQRPLKRYQLTRKIADMFDQYMVFRPDMLLSWQAPTGPGADPAAAASTAASEQWQAELWRRLAADIQVPHRCAMQKQLIEHLADKDARMDWLPPRLAVFGISHLPPFHLQVLEALARRIPIYLFLLNPCRLYWSDILSDHQMIRRRASSDHDASSPQLLYLEQGNRLLASLGHLGKHFFDFIHQSHARLNEVFRDNPETVLGQIQQDILDMVDLSAGAGEPPSRCARADGSLRIHACHSPMREVQVLYDQLLDMLAADSDLQPRDIMVMTPDIGIYAPYIHAVFGAARGTDQIRLPYSVTDQSILLENPTVEAFVQLLDMVGSRFEASRVMALLECPAIHRRFGLCDADLPVVENWIRDTAICWGWNGADRRQHNLPGFNENTWQAGLDRLMLGYAMAADNTRLFAGILPYEGIEAGQHHIIGGLTQFAESLHETIGQLASQDNPAQWHPALNRLLERFFDTNDQSARELQALHAAIDQLQTFAGDENKERLTIEVVRQYLKDTLARTTLDSGFMSGGVTFCAMLPMRSIPMRIICLLGMNHDAFPRQDHEPGFNLIALAPRKGDRSKRSDDRYLFLETLLSARDILYLSYIGQDIQDNAAISPSVVVDELLEYVQEGFGIDGSQLVARHPLHGFSPTYFNHSDPLLFSYSKENLAAAALTMGGGREQPFFHQALAPPAEHWYQCGVTQLIGFFNHPTRYIMEQRLGVYLGQATDVLEDRERFSLDPLSQYQINQQLFKAFLNDTPPQTTYAVARAAGLLPHGTVGKVLHRELGAGVRQYIDETACYGQDTEPRGVYTQIEIAPFSLHGTIDAIYPEARVVFRMGKPRPKDLLSAFIYHLVMLVTTEADVPRTSILVCKGGHVWQWGAMTPLEARTTLKAFLELYWQGLQKPLPFFCRSSFEYANQCISKKRSAKEALASATKTWIGNDFSPGESSDPYYERCFARRDPLSAQFEDSALTVFGPILAHRLQEPA